MINDLLSLQEGDSILEKTLSLQKAIESLPEEERLTKGELDPIHYFADGMYLRSLFLPEGMVCVGEMHRHSHFTILAEGRSKIVSKDGDLELEAPFVFISTPFAKRSVYAITDCTWITVHLNPDNCTDLEELAKRHIIQDEQEQLETLK